MIGPETSSKNLNPAEAYVIMLPGKSINSADKKEAFGCSWYAPKGFVGLMPPIYIGRPGGKGIIMVDLPFRLFADDLQAGLAWRRGCMLSARPMTVLIGKDNSTFGHMTCETGGITHALLVDARSMPVYAPTEPQWLALEAAPELGASPELLADVPTTTRSGFGILVGGEDMDAKLRQEHAGWSIVAVGLVDDQAMIDARMRATYQELSSEAASEASSEVSEASSEVSGASSEVEHTSSGDAGAFSGGSHVTPDHDACSSKSSEPSSDATSAGAEPSKQGPECSSASQEVSSAASEESSEGSLEDDDSSDWRWGDAYDGCRPGHMYVKLLLRKLI
ncbi:hypothetical protein OEZ85_012178 [Tetradesmus obliquus]|uniref:Uncharacterized protein n=1 Tax=Tetradesmus obliquus TaxID=3088 RepID=A0ABY8TSJ4_TETOB|nr:hypothetical protein OEZ85_012178 [Tetradesmus obliquus]